ncbi:MAG: hypothetical protein WBE68_27025 [Candidatus Nitrosopolaris sp.]
MRYRRKNLFIIERILKPFDTLTTILTEGHRYILAFLLRDKIVSLTAAAHSSMKCTCDGMQRAPAIPKEMYETISHMAIDLLVAVTWLRCGVGSISFLKDSNEKTIYTNITTIQ